MVFSSWENGSDLLIFCKIDSFKGEEEVCESLRVVAEIELDVLIRGGLGCLLPWRELIGVVK